MKTIEEVQITNKTVILRADYNVPLEDGTITDDYRILQSLPTLECLLEADCQIVIISHLGRPEGKVDESLSLQPVATRLEALLGRPVAFAQDIADVESDAHQITLLENLRFWPQEEANDADFAKRLAGLGEIFVQDGFGVVHRAHASTAAITRYLPSVAGLLLKKETETITQAMENPERPLVAIFGGAKISDKIQVVEQFIERADKILIGGAMANTFLQYFGYNIGKSNHEAGQEAVIARILKKMGGYDPDKEAIPTLEELDTVLGLPLRDLAVAKSLSAEAERAIVPAGEVADDDYILDLGPQSTEQFLEPVQTAKTVVWNGPLGMTELPQFTYGSDCLAAALRERKATVTSIIGGGDTAGFLLHWDPDKGGSFTHISTGGGAALDYMAGLELPGIAALDR